MWSHRQLVTQCTSSCGSSTLVIELLSFLWPGWGEMDLCGQIVSCHAMPVFHAISLLQITLVVSAMSSSHFHSNDFQPSAGLVMAVFEPAFPAVLPNPQNVLEGMIVTKCSIGAAVPTFLEVTCQSLVYMLLIRGNIKAWSHNPIAVNYLKAIKAVVCY